MFFNKINALAEYDKLIYDFKIDSITGEVINFKDYKNKSILLVNTASYCGFTNQYNDLQQVRLLPSKHQHHLEPFQCYMESPALENSWKAAQQFHIQFQFFENQKASEWSDLEKPLFQTLLLSRDVKWIGNSA